MSTHDKVQTVIIPTHYQSKLSESQYQFMTSPYVVSRPSLLLYPLPTLTRYPSSTLLVTHDPSSPLTPRPQCPKIAILLGCQSGKFGPLKDGASGKFGGNRGMNYIYVENCSDFSELWLWCGVTTVTNAKSSTESEKFLLKIESESGILFTIGCHFPPELTNFGTLLAPLPPPLRLPTGHDFHDAPLVPSHYSDSPATRQASTWSQSGPKSADRSYHIRREGAPRCCRGVRAAGFTGK